MAQPARSVTKILFIDGDEISFQVSQCIARVVANSLPPVELFHACDATEGLAMLENVKPDVIVIDDELNEEKDLFIDSLVGSHPPIVIQTLEGAPKFSGSLNASITRIPKGESLDGIRQILMLATTIAGKPAVGKGTDHVH